MRTPGFRSITVLLALAALTISLPSLSERAVAGGGPLLNGAFDAGLDHWALGTGSALNTLSFASSQDAGGNSNSGSAFVTIGEGPYDPGPSYVETLEQCVPVVGGTQYSAGAKALVPPANQVPGTVVDLELFWYANPNCAGGFISNNAAGEAGVGNGWQSLSVSAMSPANARSVTFRTQLGGQDAAGPRYSYAFFDDLRLLGQLGTLPGDANCDRDINSIDALLILQIGAGLIQGLPCLVNSDANEDGIVNAIDATVTLQFGARLVDRLPPG